ncbi:MAG: hypothetical protein M0Z30_23445 [Actinomycetota bacterium]|nr:hypothetical protein [Actinomycetota bacterium]
MDTHRSARRHGVSDEDLRHAGNMLEVIVLLLAEDGKLAIHAVPLRKQYSRPLEGTGDD